MYTSVETTTHKKLNTSLGNLIHFTEEECGISAHTTFGKFQIILYSPSIFRIRITKEEQYDDFSYAVVAQPGHSNFTLYEEDDQIIISTAHIDLYIEKNPVRFRFINKKGNLINEDDASFGTSWIGNQVTTYKKLQEGERFIGLGEKTGDLDRRGKGYTNWNTEPAEFHVDADPLYCSTPFYIGINNALAYGIFLDNSYKTHFNFGASNDRFASFSAEDGDMNYYFIHHDTVEEIIESYTYLTGRMKMPPLWSLGYQQCRYSYYPDTEVIRVAKTFREKKIPIDTIVLDIHYMEQYKVFSWDNDRFPDPEKMVQTLKEMGFHVVTILDPGIKEEEGYMPFEEGEEQDLFLKYPDGVNYSGQVWPGWCYFPDFTNPATRSWWGRHFEEKVKMGIEGFWNDMNEIATWGQSLPDLIAFDYEGNRANARQGRNVYGMQMARSTFEGTKELLNGKRPFNLTRSGFSGVQRYAAVWTGDNFASDEHMMLGVRLVNSLGLTGIPFSGYDVGGFEGEASMELFARWISIGAFSPFFRGHSKINSRYAEPYSFNEEVEQISRNYIQLRYKLLPYIYSLFYDASMRGMPISRSLAIDYTYDPLVYAKDYQNQYLFGPAIMVAPVESQTRFAKVYLPAGGWYDFHTGQYYEGGKEYVVASPIDKLPLFIKAGAILPMQSEVQYTSEQPDDVLRIHLYHSDQSNSFLYYEDDGESYDYEKNAFYKRDLKYNAEEGEFYFESVQGSAKSKYKQMQLIFHGFESFERTIEVNGEQIEVMGEQMILFPPICKLDPKGKVETKIAEWVQVIRFVNDDEKVTVRW